MGETIIPDWNHPVIIFCLNQPRRGHKLQAFAVKSIFVFVKLSAARLVKSAGCFCAFEFHEKENVSDVSIKE
ncbi:MAG: hypothetical protein PHP98_02690 [Kiritimatiellae bacterium]|nr:hypothetical protein [Kiritimatiellia bacterium]